MHELSITESLLKIALRHGERAKAIKITDIYLVIGDLSSVVDESVNFYWDLISENTIAEGARLHFQRIATQMKCLDCGEGYSPQGGDLACPACQSGRVNVVAGDEFFLESIAVETEAKNAP
jgi:hydrogenase nickel incorporation protein HypA/HybF